MADSRIPANIALTSECEDAPDTSPATTDRDIAALEEHTESIKSPHIQAFASPPPPHFEPGDIVWVRDYHSTGKVLGPAFNEFTGRKSMVQYRVALTDPNGAVDECEYDVQDIRPATSECVFRWPSRVSRDTPITIAMPKFGPDGKLVR